MHRSAKRSALTPIFSFDLYVDIKNILYQKSLISLITGTNIHNNCDTDIYLQWSSPRTPDTHTFFQAFGSGAVTNCLKDLGLSRLGFEHPTFRLRGECSYRLRNRCHYLFFYAYRCYIHNNDTMHEVVALSLSVFEIADLYSMEVKN